MPLFEFGSVKVQVDEDGFMENPELWNNEVALALASTEDITELTENHWKVINYLEIIQSNTELHLVENFARENDFQLKRV